MRSLLTLGIYWHTNDPFDVPEWMYYVCLPLAIVAIVYVIADMARTGNNGEQDDKESPR